MIKIGYIVLLSTQIDKSLRVLTLSNYEREDSYKVRRRRQDKLDPVLLATPPIHSDTVQKTHPRNPLQFTYSTTTGVSVDSLVLARET
jgi:hypothetical protein